MKKADEKGLKEEIIRMNFQQSVTDSPLKETFPQSDKLRANFARQLSTDWKFLVRQLGLSEAKVEAIAHDNLNETFEQAYKAMTLWTRSTGEKATKDQVIEALRAIEREDLVNELEKYA